MRYFIFCIFYFLQSVVHAQYAPQAGLPTSTAISAASSQFVEWATQCSLKRGFMDIANPSLGYASSGDSSMAIGPVDHNVVSLGDSGIAILTFANPIMDGPGPDFAVFENGFPNPSNDSQAFLELAFAEVSSDGINYTRFPASSLTQINMQIAVAGDYMYANLINNLAGKYISNYGTPFDLHELAGTPGLDVNNITHVRIVDVVGSISNHSSRDNMGHIINDPYPTPIPTGGFDLDAVGVINKSGNVKVLSTEGDFSISAYPNPATDKLVIAVKGAFQEGIVVTLTDIMGRVIFQRLLLQNNLELPVAHLSAGIYYLILKDANGNKWVEKVVKS